jgi:hypothetical protein
MIIIIIINHQIITSTPLFYQSYFISNKIFPARYLYTVIRVVW